MNASVPSAFTPFTPSHLIRKTCVLNRLVIFTSLPVVGGHSGLTEGIVRLVGGHFESVQIWCKPMPDHGHSVAMAERLTDLGCQISLFADPSGKASPATIMQAVPAARRHRTETVFLALAMRHLSVVLVSALQPAHSVYYHITHDLTPSTIRRLQLCALAFRKLAFICPATYEEFPGATANPAISWVPQSSELESLDFASLVQAKQRGASAERPRKIGLLGRLTPEKGARVMLEIADSSPTPFELHVAGSGSCAQEFLQRSKQEGCLVKVVFHGSYDPSGRADFLRRFFAGIDLLVVPSQDAWETLSMVTLEAMQHGTPSLVCATGGLISFGLPALGPAPQEVVRLVPVNQFSQALAEFLNTPLPDPEVTAHRCLAHYKQFFADDRIRDQWLRLLSKSPQ